MATTTTVRASILLAFGILALMLGALSLGGRADAGASMCKTSYNGQVTVCPPYNTATPAPAPLPTPAPKVPPSA